MLKKILLWGILLGQNAALALGFPNICDVVNSPHFKEMLEFRYRKAVCGRWPPRPCAHFEYYIPKYFIEVVGGVKDSFFKTLPFAQFQLNSSQIVGPTGVDDDEGSFSFDAHSIRVPFSSWAFSSMPCRGQLADLFCFTAMSEQLGSNWRTGKADLLQPAWLAWSAAPKACVMTGTLTSATGTWPGGYGQDAGACSFDISFLPKYPPSAKAICTGWGIHFPRTGTVTSSDPMTASLVIASRIKSLSQEVFQGMQISHDEKWQMILPQDSSSFREGQNVAILAAKGVNELGRFSSLEASRNYLYVIWQKASCTEDLPWILVSKAWIEGIQAACRGF